MTSFAQNQRHPVGGNGECTQTGGMDPPDLTPQPVLPDPADGPDVRQARPTPALRKPFADGAKHKANRRRSVRGRGCIDFVQAGLVHQPPRMQIGLFLPGRGRATGGNRPGRWVFQRPPRPFGRKRSRKNVRRFVHVSFLYFHLLQVNRPAAFPLRKEPPNRFPSGNNSPPGTRQAGPAKQAGPRSATSCTKP